MTRDEITMIADNFIRETMDERWTDARVRLRELLWTVYGEGFREGQDWRRTDGVNL